jgi:hypothetical protein
MSVLRLPEITYTCEPKCCFNHICAACYTTFELFTEPLGWMLTGSENRRRNAIPYSTVACVKCDSLEVYMLTPEGGAPVHWSAPTAMPCYS